jgi:putative flippase GtrA
MRSGRTQRGRQMVEPPKTLIWTSLTCSRPGLWLRFGLAGFVNTGFGYIVFVLLELMGCWPAAALAGSTITGIAFNFQTSRRLVFRSNGRIMWFVAVYSVVFSLNWVALRALHFSGLPDFESQALLIPPLAALSFVGQQMLVFDQSAGPP